MMGFFTSDERMMGFAALYPSYTGLCVLKRKQYA